GVLLHLEWTRRQEAEVRAFKRGDCLWRPFRRRQELDAACGELILKAQQPCWISFGRAHCVTERAVLLFGSCELGATQSRKAHCAQLDQQQHIVAADQPAIDLAAEVQEVDELAECRTHRQDVLSSLGPEPTNGGQRYANDADGAATLASSWLHHEPVAALV